MDKDPKGPRKLPPGFRVVEGGKDVGGQTPEKQAHAESGPATENITDSELYEFAAGFIIEHDDDPDVDTSLVDNVPTNLDEQRLMLKDVLRNLEIYRRKVGDSYIFALAEAFIKNIGDDT